MFPPLQHRPAAGGLCDAGDAPLPIRARPCPRRPAHAARRIRHPGDCRPRRPLPSAALIWRIWFALRQRPSPRNRLLSSIGHLTNWLNQRDISGLKLPIPERSAGGQSTPARLRLTSRPACPARDTGLACYTDQLLRTALLARSSQLHGLRLLLPSCSCCLLYQLGGCLSRTYAIGLAPNGPVEMDSSTASRRSCKLRKF